MSVAPPPISSPRRRPGPSDLVHLARLTLILTLITLLAACGGSHPKPSRGTGSTSRPSGTGAPARRGGVNDDVSRSQSSRYSSSNDSVPDDNLDVSKLVEPTPKFEPHSQYGNKSPYAVNGRSYTVLPDASGYVERGIASFYGSKFHGYKTSNFEEYDMYQFSAAHKTLPLPSFARVTNLENGKSVIVRINDRGPFHENRIIDLSYAAAVKIGVWPKGTGLVEVRAIDPKHMDDIAAAPAAVPPAPMKPLPPPAPSAPVAPKLASAPPSPAPSWVSPVPASTSPTRAPTRAPSADITVESVDTALPPVLPVIQPKPKIFLQVGAFSDLANASRVADQINKAGLGPVSIVETQVNGRSVRRVRVGPLADVDTADRLTERIAGMGLPRPQVAVD